MFKRDELKKKAKGAYYRNWKNCIIICFIYTLLIGGTIISFRNEVDLDYHNNIKEINNIRLKGSNNSDIVNDFLNSVSSNNKYKNNFVSHATAGAIGTVANNVSQSGSFLFGLLNAINQALFKDRIWASIIIVLGSILSLVYWIFVNKVLEVGKARFYLENRKYTKTKPSKLIYPYKLPNTKHIAYTMLIKNISVLLWTFTIIGGFIKYYSYRLVPFILAENPNMPTKNVLKLSKEMTYGYKWQMFKLDLSFIGYAFLGLLTFNAANIIFTNPYIDATYAEVYMFLRANAKKNKISNAKTLKEINLEGDIVLDEYPITDYNFKIFKKKWLNFNYERKYKFIDILLLFFIVSIIGWIWEVLLHLFQYGFFVNRGTLVGPWLPIYGAGSTVLLIVLKDFRKSPFVFFILAMVLCGIIEYGTSVYLELVHHLSWWSYNGYFLNLNGRICLEGLIVFGVGGVFITYIGAPLITNYLDKIGKKIKIIICIILTLLMTADFYYSSINPNTGTGITSEIENSKLDNLKINKN
ncbi:MAG: DUF975 family protein [Ruminococcus sp.]|nr:DUF975 family protein [Ruminococcus sp.]